MYIIVHLMYMCMHSRFMICDDVAAYDESIDSPEVMTQEQRKQRERDHREKLLREVNFSKFV